MSPQSYHQLETFKCSLNGTGTSVLYGRLAWVVRFAALLLLVSVFSAPVTAAVCGELATQEQNKLPHAEDDKQEDKNPVAEAPVEEEHGNPEKTGEAHSAEGDAKHEQASIESEHGHASEEEHAAVGGHGDDDAHHGDVSNFDYFLSQNHLMAHVQDADHFSLPSFNTLISGFSLFGHTEDPGKSIMIPQVSPWSDEAPLMKEPEGELQKFLGKITFQPTKFIVLEFLAAAFVFFLFVWLGKKIQTGDAPKGRVWNALESVIVFVRDEIAKPSIGSHDYKQFLPFLLTVFFFILTMNLMGMFPLFGTPTSSISITASLAISVFVLVLFTGTRKLGVIGFWKAQAPHIDVKGPMKLPLVAGIWCIEVFGLFIKHMVLAVRLFANMFAGHLVLAVLIGFVGAMWGTYMSWVVIPGVVGSSLALNMLELLVAFIQAYVFTFLAALFIGAAVHPH